MRRFAYGTLSGPEVTLRSSPRITVRGHSVQGACLTLRKAPLRSRIVPWSTKRPCGPLAFRRATEGRRVRGKMWGCQEGDKKPGGCLGPLLSSPPDGGSPGRRRRPISPAAASRRNGGTAHPLLRVKAMGRKAASTGCAAVSAEDLTIANRIIILKV